MSAYDTVADLIYRIGNATGALRVRAADAARLDRNGGTSAEMQERVEVLVARLEQVAAELEDALA